MGHLRPAAICDFYNVIGRQVENFPNEFSPAEKFFFTVESTEDHNNIVDGGRLLTMMGGLLMMLGGY